MKPLEALDSEKTSIFTSRKREKCEGPGVVLCFVGEISTAYIVNSDEITTASSPGFRLPAERNPPPPLQQGLHSKQQLQKVLVHLLILTYLRTNARHSKPIHFKTSKFNACVAFGIKKRKEAFS